MQCMGGATAWIEIMFCAKITLFSRRPQVSQYVKSTAVKCTHVAKEHLM